MDKPTHIFAEHLEPEALRQFEEAMAQPFVVKGALMPDAHTGYSLPIGAVVATQDVIVPSWVGFDIGCGIAAVPTSFSASAVRESAKAIFDGIYKAVPVGFAHNQRDTPWPDGAGLYASDVLSGLFAKNGLRQLGSLGSGNHFVEIGEDERGRVWVIVHSGSRNIGHSVATHYMRLASGDGKAREGHFGLYDSSDVGCQYVMDLRFCLEFALANRREILRRAEAVIQQRVGGAAGWQDLINRNHNHAEYDQSNGWWVHRKGATHAEAGMLGVIPGNMRDGSFIVEGLGNPDSLYSSSHGAGRAMGRKDAQRRLNVDDFAVAMRGVTAKVDADTLDESPEAYKDIHEVMRLQAGLVRMLHHVKPIINIKG